MVVDASEDPINFTGYQTKSFIRNGKTIEVFVPDGSNEIVCWDGEKSATWQCRTHDEALRELRAHRQLTINLLWSEK